MVSPPTASAGSARPFRGARRPAASASRPQGFRGRANRRAIRPFRTGRSAGTMSSSARFSVATASDSCLVISKTCVDTPTISRSDCAVCAAYWEPDWIALCEFSVIWAAWREDSPLLTARLRTSLATTANPLPASPARAASTRRVQRGECLSGRRCPQGTC